MRRRAFQILACCERDSSQHSRHKYVWSEQGSVWSDSGVGSVLPTGERICGHIRAAGTTETTFVTPVSVFTGVVLLLSTEEYAARKTAQNDPGDWGMSPDMGHVSSATSTMNGGAGALE